MASVPRPLIAVLVVTVLAFVLWTVALKHTLTGGSSGSAAGPSQPALQSAINQAKGVQSVVNGAAARAGATPGTNAPPASGTSTQPAQTTTSATAPATAPPATTTTTATTTATTTTAHTTTTPSHPAAKSHGSTIAAAAAAGSVVATISPVAATGPTGMALVDQALHQHKVLALLFYNPAAADDRAVHHELKLIPTHKGAVVRMAVPVQQLGHYSALLNEVPVNFSPTLVLVDRERRATEIAGFADSFEVDQHVTAALAASLPKQPAAPSQP